MYHFMNGVGSPVTITLTFSDSPSVTVVAGMSDRKVGFATGRFLVTPIEAEQSVVHWKELFKPMLNKIKLLKLEIQIEKHYFSILFVIFACLIILNE